MIRHFRQRPSVFISAAFVLPMCFCCYAGSGTAQRIFPLVLAFSVAFAICTLIVRWFRITFMTALVLLFCASMPFGVYLVKCSDIKYESASEYIGKCITVEGTVYYYQADKSGYTVYLRVREADGRKVEKFNLRIHTEGTAAPLLYDTAVFEVTPRSFQRTYYRPDSVLDYYRSEGIHADAAGFFRSTVKSSGIIFRTVRNIENAMSKALDKLENSDLARALIIGDKSYLDRYTSGVFTKAGIAHILALSGLHIGIILVFIRKFMGAFTLHRLATVAVSLLTVLFYIVMTGGSYSVMRAGIMAIVGFGAFIFLTNRDILNSIAIAVTLILIYEPYAVKSLSFQLSCGAVVGIAVMAIPTIKYIEKRLEKYIGSKKYFKRLIGRCAAAVLTSVSVTFSILLFTFPTALYYMGDILPVSFVSNMVIIPLTAPVMMIVIIYIIIYIIPLFPVRMAATKILIPVADFMLDFFKSAAGFFAELDIPEINLAYIAYPLFSVFVAAFLAAMILMKAQFYRYITIFCVIFAVCVTLLLFDSFYKSTEIHVLSDGASSCVFFEQDGKTYVYVCPGQDDFSYAVRSHCSEYGKNAMHGVVIPPQYSECMKSVDNLYADGIKVESIFVCRGDENEARIRGLFKNTYPDIKIYNYEISKPFLGGLVVKSDGAVEKEVFSKHFVLFNLNNGNAFCGQYGDITVIDTEKARKVIVQNKAPHNITYCKTHIFNITESKITMRCCG